MSKQATKPHRVVVQLWDQPRKSNQYRHRYRADLMLGTAICETGYGSSADAAIEALTARCEASAWREVIYGCEVFERKLGLAVVPVE